MKNQYNILSLGDIHGRSIWKQIIFGGNTEFFFWKKEVTEGSLDLESKYKFEIDWDRIIFVGDYVDSFDVGNTQIRENLEDIVLFAKTYPNLVVLLLGNHDVQYVVADKWCSGYRAEMRADLNEIFTKNKDLFRIAYLDEFNHTVNNQEISIKTLWTHAGVTQKWFDEFVKDATSDRYRHKQFFDDIDEMRIDEILNLAWKLRVDNLFNVDNSSGGTNLWAGPLWVRPHTLNDFFLEGYNQVVGHTPQITVFTHRLLLGTESNSEKSNTIVYADALPRDFHELKRLRPKNC